MTGVSPVTVTVSATPETAISMRSVTVCPTVSGQFVVLRDSKPASSAVTL